MLTDFMVLFSLYVGEKCENRKIIKSQIRTSGISIFNS